MAREGRSDVAPAHGWLTHPRSRADIEFNGGWPANGLEAGKFFPATRVGLTDPDAPTDSPSGPTPTPPDGQIASGGSQPDAVKLDEVRDWPKTDLRSGAEVPFQWNFSQKHRTRRYNYFVTKESWDPAEPLSRDQFEPEPFATYKPYGDIPHWEMPDASTDPNLDKPHMVRLPQRSGYHVVLGVWEVADTGHAFYQVMDVNFTR
ncbi:lytic polysaccharide monooxygenase auxiliary activity family 9 protein [Streptomyces sp. AK04-3B]|uniref:lytic polysaccharide monooxygenase auxiliary activity family 9 protein n=1 Tax=unclassified Streptomyces TaxID=2593676 RepID=UPI0029B79172|nr:lytic polysaccharide monooxygenase auxiliary activity family 9 protein [Streptomyces sp. AK04-3B]MDX3800482.1 lytic polysaccharide monooxygenase [Streptomyces sp. AK04-3B]